MTHRGPWLAPFGIALGVYVMAGAAIEWANRMKLGSVSRSEVIRRATNLPRSSYGTLFAHFGIGMLVVGIVATSAYREEHILVMKPGQSLAVGGYRRDLRRLDTGRGPNYRSDIADFDVKRDGASVTRLTPAKRLYDAPPQTTTEAGIHASWRRSGGAVPPAIGPRQTGTHFVLPLPVNGSRPSAEKAIALDLAIQLHRPPQGPGRGLPQVQRPVVAAGRQPAAVWAVGQARHRFGMPGQLVDLLSPDEIS